MYYIRVGNFRPGPHTLRICRNAIWHVYGCITLPTHTYIVTVHMHGDRFRTPHSIGINSGSRAHVSPSARSRPETKRPHTSPPIPQPMRRPPTSPPISRAAQDHPNALSPAHECDVPIDRPHRPDSTTAPRPLTPPRHVRTCSLRAQARPGFPAPTHFPPLRVVNLLPRIGHTRCSRFTGTRMPISVDTIYHGTGMYYVLHTRSQPARNIPSR